MANSADPISNLDASTPQLKVVKDFVDAYLIPDINKAVPLASKNFTYQTFPKIPDYPDEARVGHFERWGSLLSLLEKAELTCHEVIEAPGKVIMHATTLCRTVEGTTLDYDTLAIFTLVEEDGELKVLGVKDFANPEQRGRLHSWVAQALAKGVAA